MSETLNDLIDHYKINGFNLRILKSLKSGKEATVYAVKDSTINKIYALKIYKDLSTRSFVKRSDYLEGMFIKRHSLRHAVQKGTTLGKEYLESRWIANEVMIFKLLTKDDSKLIPHFYGNVKNSILMQFIGNENTLEPSPRLADIKLTNSNAIEILNQIADFISQLTSVGFVHADLSEFNILIKDGKAFIIDFPQSVNIITNKNAESKFEHDLNTITKYFENEYKITTDRFIAIATKTFHNKLIFG